MNEAVARRRPVVAWHRFVRARAPAIAQDPYREPAYAQPDFQSAPQAAPQAPRRLVLVRRRAPVTKAVAHKAVVRSAVGGPYVKPPPRLGTAGN